MNLTSLNLLLNLIWSFCLWVEWIIEETVVLIVHASKKFVFLNRSISSLTCNNSDTVRGITSIFKLRNILKTISAYRLIIGFLSLSIAIISTSQSRLPSLPSSWHYKIVELILIVRNIHRVYCRRCLVLTWALFGSFLNYVL